MTSARTLDVRRIAALAWPVFVGQLAVVGFTTVDTLMVARYARADLAALSIGAAAYITVFVGLMGVVMAIGPIVGQMYGAGRHAEAGHQLHQAAWIALGLAMLGAALLLFPAPFFATAQAPAEVEAKARAYLAVVALALPAALWMGVYRGFNVAISRPKAVMALQIGALVLKVPLTAALVFGIAPIGLAPLGVTGCAAATVIVFWLQAWIGLEVLRRDPHYAQFALRGRGWHGPDRRAIGAQLRLGLPIGASVLVEVSGFSLMAIFIARLGALPSAAHQIAANLTAMMFMMPLALANASMTLVAQRIGSGDLAGARRIGWHGVQFGMAIAGVMTLLLLGGRGAVARLYSADAAVVALAVPLLGWVAVFHLADAMQAVTSFVLRAWRIVFVPMLIYAGSLWGIGLGGGYVLAFNVGGSVPAAWQGAPGYWMAAATGLAVAALSLTAWLGFVQRRAVSASAD